MFESLEIRIWILFAICLLMLVIFAIMGAKEFQLSITILLIYFCDITLVSVPKWPFSEIPRLLRDRSVSITPRADKSADLLVRQYTSVRLSAIN